MDSSENLELHKKHATFSRRNHFNLIQNVHDTSQGIRTTINFTCTQKASFWILLAKFLQRGFFCNSDERNYIITLINWFCQSK